MYQLINTETGAKHPNGNLNGMALGTRRAYPVMVPAPWSYAPIVEDDEPPLPEGVTEETHHLVSLADDYIEGQWRINRKEWQPKPPPAVPEHVTRWQVRRWYADTHGFDIWAIAQGQVDAMPDGAEKLQAQIDLDDASHVRRDNPLVIAVSTAIGMTSDDVDSAFIAAAQL